MLLRLVRVSSILSCSPLYRQLSTLFLLCSLLSHHCTKRAFHFENILGSQKFMFCPSALPKVRD